MNDQLKFRHELKYQCSQIQLDVLKSRIAPVLKLDKHSLPDGYIIRSLYFDNYSNRCFFENESGVDHREKFRIRIYNADSNYIVLENKRKENGKTNKISCQITKTQFYDLLNGGNFSKIQEQPPLLRRFTYLMETQLFKPVVIVEYERIPYVHPNGNVRVTFDMNIRSSNNFDKFFEKKISSRLILPTGQHLLEVKYDELLPGFIKENLQIDDLRQTTFSKYYLCRKFSLGGTL